MIALPCGEETMTMH